VDDVEEALWFINCVLGGSWPPSELDTIPLDELSRWYQRATNLNEERRKQSQQKD